MPSSNLPLNNKRAVITGASRGLGFEIAKVFAQNGADLVLCARNIEALESAAGELKNLCADSSQKITTVAADTSKEADIDRILKAAEDEGGYDILVNNAAIQGPIGPINENDWDEWKDTLITDMFGPVYAMRRAIAYFRKNGIKGRIISISGGGATGSRPNFSAYAAAKVSIVRLSEILADENREYGIDINTIAPGAMRTAMTDAILGAKDAAGDKEIATAEKLVREGDNCKEKAAGLALFLASDKSRGITGRLISAVWDDWATMDQRKDSLSKDLYKLRRIADD